MALLRVTTGSLLRIYSGLWAGSGDNLGCRGLNLDQLYARQNPTYSVITLALETILKPKIRNSP